MNLVKSIFRLLLGRRLPILDGTVEVTGIHQQVTIRRDAYGVPYIEAQNDEDAWYGLGFCHGQDRAFQLEGLVRVVPNSSWGSSIQRLANGWKPMPVASMEA
jgi:acyl-homoserine lactone acylase PvdQ